MYKDYNQKEKLRVSFFKNSILEINLALFIMFLSICFYANYTHKYFLYYTFPVLFISSLVLDLISQSQSQSQK